DHSCRSQPGRAAGSPRPADTADFIGNGVHPTTARIFRVSGPSRRYRTSGPGAYPPPIGALGPRPLWRVDAAIASRAVSGSVPLRYRAAGIGSVSILSPGVA